MYRTMYLNTFITTIPISIRDTDSTTIYERYAQALYTSQIDLLSSALNLTETSYKSDSIVSDCRDSLVYMLENSFEIWNSVANATRSYYYNLRRKVIVGYTISNGANYSEILSGLITKLTSYHVMNNNGKAVLLNFERHNPSNMHLAMLIMNNPRLFCKVKTVDDLIAKILESHRSLFRREGGEYSLAVLTGFNIYLRSMGIWKANTPDESLYRGVAKNTAELYLFQYFGKYISFCKQFRINPRRISCYMVSTAMGYSNYVDAYLSKFDNNNNNNW
jgi:hypothetical protein